MNDRVLQVAIQHESDLVLARQRTRQLTNLLGFDKQDQTRITTAVSEIARNAFDYGGGGRVEFLVIGRTAPQLLEIVVSDSGPGIAQVQKVLEGSVRSQHGMGLGIVGAQRLMDQFTIETTPGVGTIVRLRKFLPLRAEFIKPAALPALASQLVDVDPSDALGEIRQQNQELLLSLDQVRRQKDELERLNQELEDTNRGVVALHAELEERADHLRRADELKSRFLSDMSHEFRTPLNSILALSRLLLDRLDGPLSPDQEKQIRFMRRAAENLTELVNDLLDLAKVEAGKVDVRPTEFSVHDLFGALRGMLRPLLVGEKVNLVFDDAAELPTLYADESKVSQILRNFISNALKFTQRGEVRVTAQLDGNEELLLSVHDTGIGIAQEDLDNIFQDFVQLDNPAQSHHKGTGLGLPLSKRLAQLLNGSISVRSVLGAGSTFCLRLPLRYQLPVDEAEPFIDESIPPAKGLPVLVVEDDPADLHVLEKLFAKSSYALHAVRTIAEARRAIGQAPPVAILLDVLLAGENAWQFLASLKQDPLTSAIPIIVVSAVRDEPKTLALGADAYLPKPVDRSRLLELLSQLVVPPQQIKVVVVDPQEAFRFVLRQLLPTRSYEVLEAVDAEHALHLVEQAQPDVLLVNVDLADTHGTALIDILKNSLLTSDLPMIALTTANSGAAQQLSHDDVQDVIFTEDLSTELLTSRIKDTIRRRGRSRND